MIKHQNNQVLFRIVESNADEVYLAGDFNGWTIPGIPMTQVEPGVWEASLKLSQGRCRVGYFVIEWEKAEIAAAVGAGSAACDCRNTVNARWLEEYETVTTPPAKPDARGH